jgi:choline-glycine betaine transporter
MAAEAESKMEEILNGKELDPNDWCYEAHKRVQEGSDGLWIRCGPKPGSGCASQWISFNFNPCVSLFSTLLLFGLVIFCAVKPGNFCSTIDSNGNFADKECFMPQKEFDDWMKWVTHCFTWLYVLTQDVWIVFAIYLWASKYGNIKLGREEDEPEFTYFAWFAMLFTCGVATGLFYFAVTEPLYYYLTVSPKGLKGSRAIGSDEGYYERNRWTYSGVYFEASDTPGAAPTAHGVFSTPNDRAQGAMTLTWYHWGLHGWIAYCLLGTLLGLLHFRKGLPMTIKSCFYPLIGTRIYGFMGDFLDTISVVATTMGVCTSLGLGVMQLNSGLELLNGDQHWWGDQYYNMYNWQDWSKDWPDLYDLYSQWDAAQKCGNTFDNEVSPNLAAIAANLALDSTYTLGRDTVACMGNVAKIVKQSNQQMLLIWIITAGATCSVMLGLKNGIKQLALVCLGLGQFVIFYVWMMDDTWFLTNFLVQTFGHYVGNLPTIGFYTSAVEQSEVNNPYGEYSSWQFWWTIFYWGWWIAWTPFVGVFLARTGKGRTVREFIFCTLFSSCLYNTTFMTMLGGAGIKMQMLAEKHQVGTGTGDKGCSGKQFHNLGADSYMTLAYKENVCRVTSTRKYSSEKEMFCSTITNLGCSLAKDGTRPIFDVLVQYGDTAKGMCIILLITITLYFVASSDSGSMVDDMVTANGLTEPCLIQRLYWALTEGAAAAALLSVGKYVGKADGGLKALRAASIVVGLPYTFLVCFMCIALYRALQYETGERKWTEGFKSCIVDIGITTYDMFPSRDPASGNATRCFNIKCGSGCDGRKLLMLCLYAVCPILPMLKTKQALDQKRGRAGGIGAIFGKIGVVAAFVTFFAWFLFMWLDYLPLSENLQEWGAVNGNVLDSSANTRYYLSNRWGYYHLYANKDSERKVGDPVKYNTLPGITVGSVATTTSVDPTVAWYKGQERGFSQDGSELSGNGAGAIGVGERFAFNYRIAVIGWFFFFMFVMYLVSLRADVRVVMQIQGTLLEDFLVCCFWPLALWQMEDTILNVVVPEKKPVTAGNEGMDQI